MQRTRRKYDREPYFDHWKLYHVVNGVATKVDDRYQQLGEAYHMITDVSTPNFNRLRAEGRIVNSPCSIDHGISTSGGGSYSAVKIGDPNDSYYSSGGSTTQAFGGTANMLVPISWSMDTSLMQQALSNVDKTPYAFMEDFLELKKTVGFLSNCASNLAKAGSVYASKKALGLKKGLSPEKAAANAWLAGRYGVGSLVRSGMRAMEAYYDKEKAKPERRRAKSKPNVRSDTFSDIYTTGSVTFSRTRQSKSSQHAYILYETTNPLDTPVEYLGLRLKDVPRGIWQVAPYTWVTDRFFDLSSSISALMNYCDPNIRFLASGYVEEYTSDVSIKVTNYTSPGWTTSVDGDIVEWKHSRKTRTPASVTSGGFLPSLKLDTEIGSTLDLLALAAQRFGR